MKLHSGLVTVGLLSLGLLSYSCANGDTVSSTTGNGTGNGGSNATGGSNSTGTGGTHTGGVSGTGTGGTHTGGVSGSGTGGAIVTGTGGTHTGGVSGTGTGGTIVTGTGGTTTTGTGGATMTCSATFTPTTGGWVSAPAANGTCWNGYAYNFADALGTTITPPTSMTYASCTTTCPLTAMGTVAAANAANSYATYAGIGFNINQTQGSGSGTPPTLTPAGSGLTISFTATTSLALRAQISDGTTNWCYAITGTSPVTIPYGSFNTKCYDTPADGVAYAKNPISAFQLQVPGGATAGAYTIALTGVQENN